MGKQNMILYWVSTSLLSVMMLLSVSMYFMRHQDIVAVFAELGYPAYLIYPLAIAKLLGLIAILTRKSAFLREWAYAGFFFDFLLALVAHLEAKDGDAPGAAVALVLLIVSYVSGKRLFAAR